ncbi:MAG: TetR/AcrR family transcriptional regulator [Solobacterium sp.]|nr:TetR/AcrR family transcriptional regulator [Solobacterium sp.]MDD7776192.1 TetR/AcrR family transcriptional regulator [Solobacterium sp.]MDY2953043.1 TetR/AcrR family transcriptional regulator [Erysipelotrichaceae bacterium]MDY4792404.1 TetR/AcrR family transcriptional regulator [Erysipelotrichaceae bacterium]
MATKAEETQRNILETAKRHFLSDGLTGASLRNIVKDAGLTTGAFYKYYPTKEALFDALTDPYLEHIYEIYDQVVAEFEKLSADDQTKNMASISDEGMEQMLDYVYDHYDNFKLLLKCGDSGKHENFIHGMVDREIKSSHRYLEKMKEEGVEVPVVDDSLMHMIYTGFFSSIFQIIEHDIDRITAKENIKQLKQFNIGGWERLWNVKF